MTTPKRWTKSMGVKTVVLTVRIPEELSAKVDACTLIEEKTRSDLIREWVTAGVAGVERKAYETIDRGRGDA